MSNYKVTTFAQEQHYIQCNECTEEITTCDECEERVFADSETIICQQGGFKHICTDCQNKHKKEIEK